MKKIFLLALLVFGSSELMAAHVKSSSLVRQKIVGVATDYEANTNREYKMASTGFYYIRENYVNSVQKQCAKYNVAVVIVPINKDQTKNYAKFLDGLLLAGNYFDINPKLYGEELKSDTVALGNDNRTEHEMALLNEMMKTKKPVLGICGGYQLINVAMGGSLHQNIPDILNGSQIHKGKDAKTPSHSVQVKEGTKLSKIVGEQSFPVNSAHHQAVKTLGKDLIVNAQSEDGIIEGIESTKYPFMVGVQYHPEFEITANDEKIFDAFCKEVATKR